MVPWPRGSYRSNDGFHTISDLISQFEIVRTSCERDLSCNEEDECRDGEGQGQ